MPIRPELRHLYRGPEWKAIRERILVRAGDCCERCGAPNRTTVLRAKRWWTPRTPESEHFHSNGWTLRAIEWRFGSELARILLRSTRFVGIVLTIAHLNHDPTDNRDDNLAALCQWCHFHHDVRFHAANARRTRQARKDEARPLLVQAS